MNLASRISVTVVSVVVLACLSSVVALLSARRVGGLMQSMVSDNVASVRAAAELEISLLEQRGLVASYILDEGRGPWLEQLQARKARFSSWLGQARATAHTPQERETLTRLAEVFAEYDGRRDEVIDLYERGDLGGARETLLRDVNGLYEKAYALCEELISINEPYIEARIRDGRRRIGQATLLVAASVGVTAVFGAALLLFFFQGVIRPLRRMTVDARVYAADAGGPEDGKTRRDELGTLDFYLGALASDVSETRSHLERSRAQLVTAEKLATVGKLAASVAHEIRNPLTSLKLRLYSIQREIGGDPEHDEDFRVVSEEITRLEGIIRNFLEFSRPAEIHPVLVSPSRLLDQALELTRHWLTERGVQVGREFPPDLPAVRVDADQIKQVFINLMRNAAETVEREGALQISGSAGREPDGRRMICLRFRDNGPGIAPELHGRIFEPFFSTKEQGTGLGLSIARQIVVRHGGRLELESTGPSGSTFAVWIPAAEA